MPIAFQSSSRPTIGVEVEVQLIDRKTRDLTPAALHLLEKASREPGLRLKSELTQAMVEINTPICNTVGEAGKNLAEQFSLLLTLAAEEGIDVAVSGTHPFQAWWERRIYPSARYAKILEKFQWMARRLTMFGLHVHVGMADGDRAIHVINAMISVIPHLLALSANSPYWSGKDTGLASCRAALFESFPTGGLPYYLLNWKEFQKYYEVLTATGAIQSIKDIYWDIRPHFDFGTIEVRVCDGLATLKETLALVAFIQCLVVWIDGQYQKGTLSRQVHMQRYWLAPENKWQAVRYGLEGQIVEAEGNNRHTIREGVEKLLEELKPVAVSLQCDRELGFVKDILKNGPGTARQRDVFAKTGSLVSVVESLIEEFKIIPS